MASRAEIGEFLACGTVALAGASRGGRKFGNSVHRELRRKGYRVLLLHPEARVIDGDRCFRSFAELPEEVKAAIVVTPPARTAEIVREGLEAGVRRFWLQRGAGSPEVVEAARAAGATVIDGECVLMFAEPAEGIHRVHRGILRLFGRLPR